jgi:hypothetical protein
VAFEKSLLFVFKREDFATDSVATSLTKLLGRRSLQTREVLGFLDGREQEIKAVLSQEEGLREEYDNKILDIESDIDAKDAEILRLKEDVNRLREELEDRIAKTWHALGLPYEKPIRNEKQFPTAGIEGNLGDAAHERARKVRLDELVTARLLADGEVLQFCYITRTISSERARVVASENKI